MADYAKKKNDELAALCKERNLPHTGKKADLVKRLEEHDAKQTTALAPAANDDEIDFDDEPATETAKAATTEAAANAIAAGGVGEVANPQAVPNQHAAIDPAATNDLTVAPPTEELKAPEKDFSTGLAERTLDEEIEKRKARLRRFGVSEDSEEWKLLERAQKFGNAEILGGLNTALSTDKAGKGRRGREAAEKDGGVRKNSRGPPAPKKAGAERAKKESKESGGYPGWMTAEDRERAEKRKAKFATA